MFDTEAKRRPGYNLHERFEVERINHPEAHSLDGDGADMAEEYFSRLRRTAIRIHHHIAPTHLLPDAQESSWREDNRCVSHGDQVSRITTRILEVVPVPFWSPAHV
jgi:hypothetical protein